MTILQIKSKLFVSVAVKRRRAQTQDVSTDASNASDVNNKIAKSKNDTPVDPNVALIKSSYVVPKGNGVS